MRFFILYQKDRTFYFFFLGLGFATLISDFGSGEVSSILRSKRSNFGLFTTMS